METPTNLQFGVLADVQTHDLPTAEPLRDARSGLTKSGLLPAARCPTCQAWTGLMGAAQRCGSCISRRGAPWPSSAPAVVRVARVRPRRSFTING